MSQAEKKKLRDTLMKLGISYGDIASVDVMNLGVDATAAILSLGVYGLTQLYNVTADAATNFINAVSTTQPLLYHLVKLLNKHKKEKQLIKNLQMLKHNMVQIVMKLLRQDVKEVILLLDIREKEEVKLGLHLEMLEDKKKQNKRLLRKQERKD